eukprot:TRINITY_DN25448_c0_g1_i1.p1 TRINITY_DN25448_c0_g1~~TRINITY_DN25448_c0_g1_i1.p1  ORF type:complete len:543 (-),score=113.85 TRINITY_DN25448_c0_g1_i1:74-1576(-)
MAAAGKASRAAFFVFDPTLVAEGPHPTEEEQADAKIVYYSPSCAPHEEKRSQVGLIEGLISFAAMFDVEVPGAEKPEPLRSLRTKHYVFSILEAEPHTWMVLVMRHPQQAAGGGEPGAPDEDAVTDNTLQAALRNCYSIFRLLHGELQAFMQAHSIHKLFDLLEDFVPAFLETLQASDFGIFQELDGFRYGPVERHTCISIHCFLLKLQEQFPAIRHAGLLYNAHLIYTTLPLDDMRVLYSYLVSFNGAVSNHKLNRPPFGRIPTAASHPGGGSSSYGRALLLGDDSDFLLGVSRRQVAGSSSGPAHIFVPTCHLADGPGQLVALTYQGMMLILVFEEGAQLDARILESVRSCCTLASGDGLSLLELRPLVAQQFAQVMEQEDEYRFLYYNSSNHALRLSSNNSRSLLGVARGSGGPGGTAAMRPGERGALCPIRDALSDPQLRCHEVSVKAADRGWICAKRWREREFYLLLDGSGVSLSKCQEECARFASIHFSNIFMM